MKLVRVIPGLYRNEDGSVVVSESPWQDKLPWRISYTNFFGTKTEKRFRTLKECRQHLEDHSFA